MGTDLTRRQMLRALTLVSAAVAGMGAAAAAAGCAAPYADTRLRVATGGTQGVYYALGGALAQAWQTRLGLAEAPAVLPTAGSVQNLSLLAQGAADVVFCAADAAAEAGGSPRALARIYNDVVHVVVGLESPAGTLDGLRGLRVSVGAPSSGVAVIANRLLAVAGLDPRRDLVASELGINDSVAAMASGGIDAFFWSGGLPTPAVSELAARRPIRLLDLSGLLRTVRERFPVYEAGTVPAASYGIPEPISTLFVRNFLLVAEGMADGLAEALVAGLFEARPLLAQASPVARTIDLRTAIGTEPVPLHPGAERYYRAAKDA